MEQEANQLYAEDLTIGQVFEGSPVTIGQSQFETFRDLTGDAHPIHYDKAYAANTIFKQPVAHGLLLVAMTVLGALPVSAQLKNSMIALVGVEFRILAPVLAGDQVHSHFRISAIEPKTDRQQAVVQIEVKLLSDSGQPVLEGQHTYLLKANPGAKD